MTKNINKRFEELQPYVLAMRFNKGLTVIDTNFKEGWSVPKSDSIGFETIPDKPNYYMLYPLIDEVGIDEILDYVDYVIKINIEREMKYNLLLDKIRELEDLFKRSSLSKCETLQFTFNDIKTSISEGMSLNDMPLEHIPAPAVQRARPAKMPRIEQKARPKKQEPLPTIEIKDGEPPLSQVVEREVSPEVDAWNRQAQNEGPTARNNNEIIDLPPRNSKQPIELESFDIPEVICNCNPNDPNEVCPVCYENKM